MMIRITYVEHDGTEHAVDASPGETLMSVALDNAVPGIDGDCGGNCACATCHIYIDGELGAGANDEERDMLSIADNVQENSRLGCQIQTTDAMDGLVVRLPSGQH
jgi:2Fe-2S ferredoxin